MQPPAQKVPPLVIQKQKTDRRPRKTGGNRVRSTKSKTEATANNSLPGVSSRPTSVMSSRSPQNTSTCTTTINSSTPVADVINQVVPHPALKDTKLSTLPSSSLAADGSDDRLIASELLASLFEKSLANSRNTTLLPPHNTLSDLPIANTSKPSQEAKSIPETSSAKPSVQQQLPEYVSPASIPRPHSLSPQPINLASECETKLCTDRE